MYKKSKILNSAFLIPMMLSLSFSVPAYAADPSEVIQYVDTSSKVIALTFDEGDNPGKLQYVIDTLNTNDVKSTFFLTGSGDVINSYGDVVKQAFNNGHLIGNHTYSHPDLTTLSHDAIVKELETADAAIKSVIGQSPVPYFRPPQFIYNSTVLQAAGDAGYERTINCSVDSLDWTGISSSEIISNVLDNAFPGSIVSLHVGYNTPEALQGIITGLKDKGYKMVTISELLQYTSENHSITPVRYGGADRFETSAKLCQAGWSSSDNVVLVNGLDFADAMAGIPFAYTKDAPILLTYPDVLSDAANNEIIRLNAKNIYIIGGTGVVSSSIESSLKNRGFNVFRYAGSDRFRTAVSTANEVLSLSSSTTAVITSAYNYPDALSISPYAAINGYPILYTDQQVLNETTKNYLIQKGIAKVIIPGLYGAVSQEVENQLKNMGISVQRIGGADRYLTSYEITSTFQSSFGNDALIASGENFPDALSGGALAARKRIPVLLVDKNSIVPESSAYIKSKGDMNLYISGGTGVISDNLVNLITGN